MRYAVVTSGGKQYKAVEGGTIDVDRLPLEVGKKIEFKDVLLVSNGKDVAVGTPSISGAKVTALVLEQFKGPKVIVFKYRPKQRYRVKKGHRQHYTRLLVETIDAKGIEDIKEEAQPAQEKPKAKPKPVAKATAAPKKAEKPASKPKAEARPKAAAKPKKEETKEASGPSTRAKLETIKGITARTANVLETGGITSVAQTPRWRLTVSAPKGWTRSRKH